MRMNKIIAAVVAVGLPLTAVTVSAQSTNKVELQSMQDYLRVAALRNRGLEAAFNTWKAELERVTQVRTLPDPRFNFRYFIEEVETRVGPQQQSYGLSQTFPWFGKLGLRGDAASLQAEAARQAYEAAKLDLFAQVKSAYYDFWYLEQSLAITRRHIALMKNLEAVARIRFKAGTASHSSVVQAQVELGKLDDRLRSLEALRAPLQAGLNALLSRPVDQPLLPPKEIPEVGLPYSDDEALQKLVKNNPRLRRLGHLAEKESIAERLAKKDAYPDITLGVDYIVTGNSRNPDTVDDGKDPVVAAVSLNLPLWFGKYRAGEREAALRRSALIDRQEDSANLLQSELRLALYRYHDAERKIDLYGNTLVPKAEESLAVTKQSFENGKNSFVDLIEVERTLLEFQLAHRQAMAEKGRQAAEVERLVGNGENDKTETN